VEFTFVCICREIEEQKIYPKLNFGIVKSMVVCYVMISPTHIVDSISHLFVKGLLTDIEFDAPSVQFHWCYASAR
jgi:hypothetical protein